jgi:hypothetical protein
MAFAQWMRSIEWLAAASDNPQACKAEWRRHTGIALLAAGRMWDVLIAPQALGLRASSLLDELAWLAPGPSLLDNRRHEVGFLLPPHPDTLWVGTGMRYLTTGTWVAVPAPHCRWGFLHWLSPPHGTGTLNMPDVMEEVLQRAMSELAHAHGNPPLRGCHHPQRTQSSRHMSPKARAAQTVSTLHPMHPVRRTE